MNPNVWRPTGDEPLIVLDEQVRAFIRGTKMRVSMVWRDYDGNGWPPLAIQKQHPHLTLAQIHAALSYYYDHREAIDAEIAEDDRYAEKMRPVFESRPGHREFMEKVQRYREAQGIEPRTD
ncbi:MAG: DUF433 domain-containing protein [Gemmataceae bacterium]